MAFCFPRARPRSDRPRVARLAAAAPAALLCALLIPGPGRAQQQGYGQTLGVSPLEQQLYNGDPRGSSGGSASPLGSGNPLDIMNAIRRNSSLSDATPPASAIDDALKDFESRSAPGATPSGPRLPGP